MAHAEPQLPGNRRFGAFLATVAALGAAYAHYHGAMVLAGMALAGAALSALVALLQPAWLLPANRAWMSLGHGLGRVVSPLVLGLLYFGVFTPLAMCMRLAGRDELRLRQGARVSHWRERAAGSAAGGDFKQQF